MAADLFAAARKAQTYTAKDIEVLEGLEPVRRRPGMYVGGTDERALHHLVAEVLDNAMDEAVAGHADWIEIELEPDGHVMVRDNGRGIPVDPHPKFKNRSALEIVMTTLHSGGKFTQKSYATAGGLHGVGISVVNALSDELLVEVARDRKLYRQTYSRGKPKGGLKEVGAAHNRRGTMVRFHADPEVFGKNPAFKPATVFRMARSKAYLFKGVEIRWRCAKGLLKANDPTPAEATLHFPDGLRDSLAETIGKRPTWTPQPFAGEAELPDKLGRVEWAIAWPGDEEGETRSYCNTVPTPQGGSHELGLRSGLSRSLRAYGERVGNRRAAQITAEDVVDGAVAILSLFIKDPQFQGQTKERLGMPEAQRLVETAIKDHFDHWLSDDPAAATALLERVVERADERMRRRQEKDLQRKSATRKLRLPGKLADCSRDDRDGTELFLVEGDSAGGSAKQARNRETQAVLPLRGKILNVASASVDKLRTNQELADLMQALGCGTGELFSEDKLRYDRVVIMTDADVDGAHIASLLMTFFYREMPKLIETGHLYLAMPPLYRLAHGGTVVYARDDPHKDELLKTVFKGKSKIDISRFKGLGEMPAAQLKETTMSPGNRTLLQVRLPDSKGEPKEARETARLVERLMGRKPELRLEYIQEHAKFVRDLDV
ncbi:MAG TPA: DNA topoisomerase IV subunit B [Alphaproteobacteria bacterium]|nr:DNA topoisomerase IV subunit B [Alphaproteobacteria bacterium]